MHRSLLAQDETLLSTTGAGAMEQRGSRGAAALRKTTSAVAGRDFGYEWSMRRRGIQCLIVRIYTPTAPKGAFMTTKTLQRAGAVARAAYVLMRTQWTKQMDNQQQRIATTIFLRAA